MKRIRITWSSDSEISSLLARDDKYGQADVSPGPIDGSGNETSVI